MSDLTRTRDHMRAMAEMTEPVIERTRVPSEQGPTGWVWQERVITPLPTPAERELWTQLADEIDVYLTGNTEQIDLFGRLTVVPDLPEETA